MEALLLTDVIITFFIFKLEVGSHYVAQAGIKLLGPGDLST